MLGAIARERGRRAGDPGVRHRRAYRRGGWTRPSTAQRLAQQRAIRISIVGSSVGELAAGLALAGVVVLGVLPRRRRHTCRIGQLTAFLFLVTLFIQPVQIATEVLNEAQNAIAGWRRVLDVLDIAPDVADPGEQGVDLPAGPLDVRFAGVSLRLPGRSAGAARRRRWTSRRRRRVAVVGETGSGKTTFAKLLTRLMDPTAGRGAALRRAAGSGAVRRRCAPGW